MVREAVGVTTSSINNLPNNNSGGEGKLHKRKLGSGPLPPPLQTLKQQPFRSSPLRHTVDSPRIYSAGLKSPQSPYALLSPTRRRLREEHTTVEQQLFQMVIPDFIKKSSFLELTLGLTLISISVFILLANLFPTELIQLGIAPKWIIYGGDITFGEFGEKNVNSFANLYRRELKQSLNSNNANNADTPFSTFVHRVDQDKAVYTNYQCKILPPLSHYEVLVKDSIKGNGILKGHTVVGGSINGKFSIGSGIFSQRQTCTSLDKAGVESAALKIGGFDGKTSNIDGEIQNGNIESISGNGNVRLSSSLMEDSLRFGCNLIKKPKPAASFDVSSLKNQMNDLTKQLLNFIPNANMFQFEQGNIKNIFVELNKKDSIHMIYAPSKILNNVAVIGADGNFISRTSSLFFTFFGTDNVVMDTCDSSVFDNPNKIIFNFPDVKEIKLSNLDGYYTILAPNAKLILDNVRLYGNVYAKEIEGNFKIFGDSQLGSCIPIFPNSEEYNKGPYSGQTKEADDVIHDLINSWANP